MRALHQKTSFGTPTKKTGLVLGKFLPLHRGHMYLIESALSQVDELYIVVGTLSREPIPGVLRFQWMRELFPTATVLHLDEELPQAPSEHPDFWEIWTGVLLRILPCAPQVVFSSEDYGDELARRLGATHHPVDKARTTIPISGTKIRQDPFGNWHFLPSCVRAYFAKRVVLFGAESTWKSTLCQKLSEHFETVYVPEYARALIERKPPGWTLAELTSSDFSAIVSGQILDEERLVRQANKVLFCDTDPLSSTVWSERYLGSCEAWIREEAMRREYALYLFSDLAGTSWSKDQTRDSEHLQEEMHKKFREALERKGAPYVLLSGTIEERLQQAIEAIEGMLRPS